MSNLIVLKHLCNVGSVFCKFITSSRRLPISSIYDLRNELVVKKPNFSTSAIEFCFASKPYKMQSHLNIKSLMLRHNSSYEKTPSQILSKLFPPTSTELVNTETEEKRKYEYENLEQSQGNWKKMKYGYMFLGGSGVIMSLYALYFFGQPQCDEEGNYLLDEFSSPPVLEQYVSRSWNAVIQLQRLLQEPSSHKLLPDLEDGPYMQPSYTLVLELKDLLIHADWTYETGWRFKKRPGVDKFLHDCAKFFEIVVYTSEQGATVFPLLDALDPNGFITYRLVRDSTHYVGGHHVKNLDNLNRDLRRVVVVDWDNNTTKLHPSNLFMIPRWLGNDDDRTLSDLASFLTVVACSEVADVREVLQYYNQFSSPIDKFRENQQKLSEKMQAEELEQKSKPKPMVKNWTPNFFAR